MIAYVLRISKRAGGELDEPTDNVSSGPMSSTSSASASECTYSERSSSSVGNWRCSIRSMGGSSNTTTIEGTHKEKAEFAARSLKHHKKWLKEEKAKKNTAVTTDAAKSEGEVVVPTKVVTLPRREPKAGEGFRIPLMVDRKVAIEPTRTVEVTKDHSVEIKAGESWPLPNHVWSN